MKNILTTSGKFSVIFACVLILAISAIAQIKLRTAINYDTDTKADYTVFRPSNNVWYINKSNGGFTFQQFGITTTDYMAPGDFDGDGLGDISVWRDTDGVWYRLNSNGNTFYAQAWGISGDEPIARDYDGDNKTDLAVVRRTGGAMIWYVLYSQTPSFIAYQFGLSTDYTAPGDYDGDGKFDYGIQRPGATPASQSTFYIAKSTGGFDVINWGLTNDLVVPGDYDGDNKTDIAVVREGATPSSNLTWYIRKSTDGNLLATAFGITGSDLNVQNDYDGDGKTDIAIWRDTTGTFYVLTSGSNFQNATQTQWGVAGDYPVASYDTH